MLQHPARKYRPYAPVPLADRQWPNRVISSPPIWLSTDLRDGNQALFEPMDGGKKPRMFEALCRIGFKEIEVAFPSASRTEFDFTRMLIEAGHIPGDVTIGVLTQAREHLIRRTFESIRGARRAIVHIYNATSNVDLVTLALNLYTQGVPPGLDFADINAVARVYEDCTQLPVHPRHPYAGDLVFTAFSGSHQDAIKKGFAIQKDGELWNVPYLPIDPADVGRSYGSVVRVNSQSGKGGIAYLLETGYGVVMPRRLQVEFSGVVQRHTEASGGEVSAAEIWRIFSATYLDTAAPVRYREHHLFERGKNQGIRLSLDIDGTSHLLTGEGNGPIDAAIHALRSVDIHAQVRSYEERSMAASADGGEAQACAFVEIAAEGRECYGVGIDANIVTASLKAIVSALNRCGTAAYAANTPHPSAAGRQV
ncbi:2-isopropylmalate synthase [Methylomagnum ishizawai]|uniref:2-isopropylmalate synthase n=1 Tax=Methylomagnum ishizawai TaxID=1760988 RepID=A0A1Y6CVL4_9GAMM|nr:alpha-isopropylmalate synthase regulatory domain-containing protein [Methylomagnum ishizawai]SMF94377.1 2-isopropylmalate synthase [Methylomagnum ishizawai]